MIWVRKSSLPSRDHKVAFIDKQSVIKYCAVFADRSAEAFRDCKCKLRSCLSLYRKLVFEVLQNKAQPSSSGSTNSGVDKFEDKRAEDVAENGHAPWGASNEKYYGHTKEARRGYQ